MFTLKTPIGLASGNSLRWVNKAANPYKFKFTSGTKSSELLCGNKSLGHMDIVGDVTEIKAEIPV